MEENKTIITEVEISPIKPKNGLIAMATCLVDGKIFIGSIGLNTKMNGEYRLTYPNRKFGEGAIDIYHPISKECGDAIKKAIVDKYERLLNQMYD